MIRRQIFAIAFACTLASACTQGNDEADAGDGSVSPIQDGGFVCVREDAVACLGNTHFSCTRDGEFLSTVEDDCDEREDGFNICVTDLGCRVCRPNEVFCRGGDVVECNEDGTDFELVEDCDLSAGFICDLGMCKNLCQQAIEDRSYQGCEFYGADLDNASLGAGRDASGQQYSIVVSNPSGQPTEVVVERNDAAPGDDPRLTEVERITVLPGDLEVLNLPRREVDGSSTFAVCEASSECPGTEACWCAGDLRAEDPPPDGEEHRDCRCRNAAGADGMNDGTHTALTSNAYRVTSVLPIIAYQFNPLDNVGVFSNDASLLLPTSAVGQTYTVVGWPQTIADSDDPNEDFDPGSDDEDLRAFLTIVGTQPDTNVTITFGPQVRRVIGLGERRDAEPGDNWDVEIGPFDVINLETGGFNADFTGTLIDADKPVSVFVGSEASDAPRFDTLSNRQCCADHLEEQLFPNDTLGRRFFIGRMPPRSSALNRAFITDDSVGEFNEPEYVRVVAVESGTTTVETTLPSEPTTELAQYESVIFVADQDMEINADKAVAVLQVLPSQQAVGIPSEYPGGDPAIVAVPPVEQYREEYVFLTPSLYAFDFITIVAERDTTILLDEQPLSDFECETAPADGIERRMGDPPPDWEVHRCQFSFPDVFSMPPQVLIEDGVQNDGYHTLRADEPVGIVIYGFDAFVSYAYAGGLNLEVID
ncbi:MAG TPA: IgGFc-binding protein [Sandaracinaceae bacterium LLY-WYZ-13_1]|nr:IgGFc-binding protein [Sandaracinaceae bacterium LLY-WYZ-13_1]